MGGYEGRARTGSVSLPASREGSPAWCALSPLVRPRAASALDAMPPLSLGPGAAPSAALPVAGNAAVPRRIPATASLPTAMATAVSAAADLPCPDCERASASAFLLDRAIRVGEGGEERGREGESFFFNLITEMLVAPVWFEWLCAQRKRSVPRATLTGSSFFRCCALWVHPCWRW